MFGLTLKVLYVGFWLNPTYSTFKKYIPFVFLVLSKIF